MSDEKILEVLLAITELERRAASDSLGEDARRLLPEIRGTAQKVDIRLRRSPAMFCDRRAETAAVLAVSEEREGSGHAKTTVLQDVARSEE